MAKFAPGRSGNPAGRPAGTGKAAKLTAAIADDLPDILAVLVREAKTGNVQAAALLLARCIPPLKQTAQPVRPRPGRAGANRQADLWRRHDA